MAKLPPIEIVALQAEDELHKGKVSREKALRLLADAGDGPLARKLRAAVSKRGRQPFGAKYRWYDIGSENDEMKSSGFSYTNRMETLSVRYMLDPRQIEAAIAKYEAAMAEIREIQASHI